MKIYVTEEFVGFHRWVEAPQDVEFLRALHRHLFKVKLTLSVDHDDRELEFFQVKRKLTAFLRMTFHEKKDIGSCEMIGTRILRWAETNFGQRRIEVDVSEDGENGAIVDNY